MAQTNIPVGSQLAVKIWSPRLATDVPTKSYWNRRFIGDSENSVIHQDSSLANAAGDKVQFDLSAKITGSPVTGDNVAEGQGKQLRFFSDEVLIDQARMPVDTGGKMTKKRTIHNLRTTARNRSSDYWATWIDQLIFMYLSGARGINADFHEPVGYAGHGGNAFTAPDSSHILYGGAATSKATITSSDKMTKALIERAETHAQMMTAIDPQSSEIVPVMVEGGDHYVVVMSPWQEHDLRVADTTGWLDIQKAAAGAEGRNNPIFRGNLGMIKSVVLHKHRHVVRFSDYGSGTNLHASRALFMGRQAGVMAYGSSKKLRYEWSEREWDHGNRVEILSGLVIGFKKATFNNRDFGICALDTYAANPN